MNLHLSLKKACVSDLYNAYSVIVKVAEMESYNLSIRVNIENFKCIMCWSFESMQDPLLLLPLDQIC